MNSVIQNRQKSRSSPPQPIDRHLSEIGQSDGTIYVNAGIDSTCSKKQSQTIHKLTDGIVLSTTEMEYLNFYRDALQPSLLNRRTHDNQVGLMNNGCCIHCVKASKVVKDN